jgi:manganese/zinc/iron transport system permease protein
MSSSFVQLSLTPLLIGSLAAAVCALLGNFLVLRRQSLIGDAISHVALPGIVIAFLLTGTIHSMAMMIGAALAALVAVGLIETIRVVGRVEPGAAMGVVFTALFAGGIVLLEQSGSRNVHIDVEHALYGNLESLIWLAADGWPSLLDRAALAELPPALPRLAMVSAVAALFVGLLWKELVITTFDVAFARMVGIRSGIVGFALVTMVAVAAVAAFDAVGSIIVIAMFVCPPAAARLMTDRLDHQIAWSLLFAVTSAVAGYVLAGYGPLWLGARSSVSAAGMIATVSGLLLAVACVAGPKRRGVRAAARVEMG